MLSSVQPSLNFPVRKTRSQSCKSKTVKDLVVETKSCDRNLRSTKIQERREATRRKLFCFDDEEFIRLPGTTQNQESNAKENETDILFSPSKRQKENDSILANSPSKKTAFGTSPSKAQKESSRKLFTSPKTRTPALIHLAKPELSIYQKAKQSLNVSVPTRLVCREREIQDITQFLSEHLDQNKSGSLYICGKPGTGKTACLSHTLKVKETESDFKTIFLNCMNMSTPTLVYQRVASELGCFASGSNKQLIKTIENHLCKKGHMWILVLDEIDMLESSNQEVLYTIFDWPRLKGSRLILIGIANTLDLTDRILPRLQSMGCAPTRLKFNPYNKNQIVAILEDRLKEAKFNGIPLIKPVALQMCATKVASCTGDIRKALDMCRRAIELLEIEAKPQQVLQSTCNDRCNPGSPRKSPSKPAFKQVEISQFLSIINQIYGSRVLFSSLSTNEDISSTLPLQEKVLVCTLLLFKKHMKGPITVSKLQEMFSQICKKRQISSFPHSEFFNACSMLESKGLITLKKNKQVLGLSKITILMDEHEAEHVLRDKTLLSSILSDISILRK